MKKNKSKKNKSKASAKSEADSSVVANVRLVDAIKSFDVSKAATQSYLVEIGTIVQEEQCTRAEVVASIVEARGCTPETANQQYSRMKKIFTDPEALEELRSGESDLKSIRERTKKPQKNPSQKVKLEAANKRFVKGVGMVVTSAKEVGMDKATIINTINAALKKNGIK